MKILHLYPDLMNLYGDGGNLRALSRRLADQGEPVSIDRLEPGQTPDFAGYGLLYLGPGTERSQKAALEHLRPHAGALRDAMEGGTFGLFTGNAASMLGREVADGDGKVWPGLGLLDFAARERKDRRYTGDAILRHPDLDRPVVGFLNKCESWEGQVSPLFQAVMGEGDFPDGTGEGFVCRNFFGTHLIGPLLVKNPHFHTWFLGRLLGRELKEAAYPHEERAYEVTLQALLERTGKG